MIHKGKNLLNKKEKNYRAGHINKLKINLKFY